MYSQAANSLPLRAIAIALNPRQSRTLPEGTVAFCSAAYTCHWGLFCTSAVPFTGTGQAMNPLAPWPSYTQWPIGVPGVYSNGPVDEPGGMYPLCGTVKLRAPVGST